MQALDVFSCIYNPGFRLIWDHRIKESSILQRFSQAEFLFYLVLRGIGPIYWPRDYIGVEGVRFYKSNGEVVTTGIPSECSCIDVIWTSVNNPPHGPQEGKVRATMNLVAYRIQNRGNGCEVTFMISICMSGPIPGYIRRMLVAECPLSLARLRDAIPTFGVAPYLIDEQCCLVIQRHFWDAESRKSHMRAFSTKAGTVVIVLDTKRMYPSGELRRRHMLDNNPSDYMLSPLPLLGIMMPTIEGPGATSVGVQEAITGDRLFVHVDGTALGKMWTLVSVGVGMRSQSSAADSSSFRQQSFEPRDKDPEPDASGDWW